MINDDSTGLIHFDNLSNLLKQPGIEEKAKEFLKNMFEKEIDGMIARYKELPSFMIHHGKYSELLVEARELYVRSKYYSCVAMCGIAAESIAKELLRRVIYFQKGNKIYSITDKQTKQLYRISSDIVRELLFVSDIIDEELRDIFSKLAKLRDKYVHRLGENPQADAHKAIEYLHKIIEGSVSVYKNFDIKDGKLVPKK